MDITTIIGTSGATLILIAFFLNQIGKWKTNYLAYDSFNLIGGGLMTTYAYLLNSWPFFILNGVWTLVSIKDVISYFFAKTK